MTDLPPLPPFEPGQLVTVFRSRLTDDPDGYGPTAARMVELARENPGLVDVKTFTADDGERVAIVTFADAESQMEWRRHAEHAAAQAQGRDRYYSQYSLQVCTCDRVSLFQR
jgi:heme-degrading monooxygenase HmoA